MGIRKLSRCARTCFSEFHVLEQHHTVLANPLLACAAQRSAGVPVLLGTDNTQTAEYQRASNHPMFLLLVSFLRVARARPVWRADKRLPRVRMPLHSWKVWQMLAGQSCAAPRQHVHALCNCSDAVGGGQSERHLF